mgnify:FL=1|jgi:hypothetical protein
MNKTFFSIYFSLVTLCISFGCRYENHQAKTLNSKLLFVEIVRNDSTAPQLGSLLSSNLRKEIIRTGTFELTSAKNNADFILKVSLDKFGKNAEVYNPQDTLLASGFNADISALVTLESENGDKLINKKLIKENSSVLRESIISSPLSRQPINSLSIGLSKKISRLIENFGWR